MKIKVTSKKTKDTFYTLVPLNWLLRVFHLSCIYRKGNQLKVSRSLTKTVIHILAFGFVNFYLLLFKIQRLGIIRNNSTLITFSDTTQMTYLIGYFEYTIDLFYVYKYGRDCSLKYFKSFDHIDQILGMTYYDEIRKVILKTIGFCVIIFIVISVIDYTIWVQSYGWLAPTLYALDYFYFFLNMLSVLDGLSHVVQLEYRLKVMIDLLQGYYNSSNCMKPIPDDNKTRTARTETRNSRLESLETLSHGRFMEVIGFNRCYLLLLAQTSYMNSKFGVRMLIFCINLIINMINLMNVAIRFATGSKVLPNGVTCLPSLSGTIRLLNWAVIAVIMVHRCEYTYRQCERILEIVDLLLVNKNNSDNLTRTLVNLRNLLLTRPIKFHAINFFNIEYTLLVSVSSTVVTYTIIFLQNLQ